MEKIELVFEDTSYPYHIGAGCRDEIAGGIAALGFSKAFIVTDPIVAALYGDDLQARLSRKIPCGMAAVPDSKETGKTIEAVAKLAEAALDFGVDRRSVIVALGGGIPGDMGGLLAGLLYRGIPCIHVPTTLIAMHDAVISLKQAVNCHNRKNILGMYRVPEAVFADTEVLETLDWREVQSGLVESIKNTLAICPKHFDEMARFLAQRPLSSSAYLRLLEMAIDAKSRIMVSDKFERREGLVLEYGHTVGHAIELPHAEIDPGAPISHGGAVGIGMRVAGRIARARGYLSGDAWRRHEASLDSIGIRSTPPDGVSMQSILDAVLRDNKRGLCGAAADEVAMIILQDLGQPVRTDGLPLAVVSLAEISDALDGLNRPDRQPGSRMVSEGAGT